MVELDDLDPQQVGCWMVLAWGFQLGEVSLDVSGESLRKSKENIGRLKHIKALITGKRLGEATKKYRKTKRKKHPNRPNYRGCTVANLMV